MRSLALLFLLSGIAYADASLTHTLASSDVENFGTLGSYSMNPSTTLMWVRLTDFTAPRRYFAKQGTTFLICQILNTTTGGIRCRNDRATPTTYDTSTGDTSLNVWMFIAVSYDQSASAGQIFRIYTASGTATVKEVSYTVQNDGSGAFGDYTANNFTTGNSNGATQSPAGQFAFVMVVNKVMSLSEIRDQQFTPHIIPGTKLFSYIGQKGTGTQPDLSGNGNNGTVTGTAVSTLGPPITIGGCPL